MNTENRKKALKQGGTKIKWAAEPMLGSVYGDEEIEAVVRTIKASMNPEVGFGFFCAEIEEFEKAFASCCGTAHAVAINGAGTGLDMAMMSLDLEPGDEVICPSLNFRAAPMSIVGQGGRWVPCDIDPKTFQADPEDIEKRITHRTRAIFPVHMNGLAAPMDDYLDLAERHPHPKHGPLKVISDAARSCGGSYKGRKIGKDGWTTVFSFHTQKLMTTLGEGGMITTDDPDLLVRLKGIRHFGGERHWGSNYKMTKVQAAVGTVQLGKLELLLAQRRRVAAKRRQMLSDIRELTLPYEPPDCRHTYYLFTLLVPEEWAGPKRDQLLRLLKEDYGVDTVVANPPVHSTVPFLAKHTGPVSLPVTDKIAARLFCLPIHPLMSESDNTYLSAALIDAVEQLR